MNLLQETINEIKFIGKTPDDIRFIGSYDTEYECTWEEFQELANFNYNDNYGSIEVARDLVIVFSDNTYLRRREYDGSEWWEYIQVPQISEKKRKAITALRNVDYETSIKELN